MSQARTRRIRRQQNQALRFGQKAKPRHKLKSGRTGMVFHKQMRAKKIEAKRAGA